MILVFAVVAVGFASGTIIALFKLGPLAAMPWLLSTAMAFGMTLLAVTVSAVLDRMRQLEERLASRGSESAQVAPHEVAAPTAPQDPEAVALLRAAQDQHFEKQFTEAKQLYADLVARFPDTKQAAVAAQQLENLRNS